MTSLVYCLLKWILDWKIFFPLVFGFIFILSVRKSESNRLIDQIPGPKSVFLFGHLFLFVFKSHEEHFKIMIQFYKDFRFAPLLRFWMVSKPYVLVTNAVAAEKILSSSREINKSSFYKFLEPWLGLGLLTSNGRKWHNRRKLLTPSFHFGILAQFVPILNEQSIVLVSKLRKHLDKDFFDVSSYVSLCTLDIICETAMGRKIEAQQNSDSEYVKAVHEMGMLSLDRVAKPWLQIPWIFNLSSNKTRQDKCLHIIHSFSQRIIEEKKKSRKELHTESKDCNGDSMENGIYGTKKRKAFLDTLLEASGDDGIGLTDLEIREEVDTFMFEGHDTTAAAIIWVLFCLGCHPEIQYEVHNELDRVFGDDMRSVTVSDLKELKYLEAVIKECLRLFPSVPLFSRTLTQDVDIEGYKVPKGTDVVIATHAIHTDPAYFADPYRFNPGRFLGDKKGRNPFSYVPFSAGPRNCIGQKFAIMEEKVVLSHILKNFRVSCLDEFDEMELFVALILLPSKGMHIRVEKRSTQWVAEE